MAQEANVAFLEAVSQAAAQDRLRSIEGHRVTHEPQQTPRLFDPRTVK